MAYDYDKLYGETQNALGEPNPVFAKFFDEFERRGARVLDVGCGQGRDALLIGRQGHMVVGVDISANGIRDFLAAAAKEHMVVEGIVADITTYTPEGKFDVILIDRTLHMLPKEQRLSVLNRLCDHVDENGWVLIADDASNIDGLKHIVSSHPLNWTIQTPRRGYLFAHRTSCPE